LGVQYADLYQKTKIQETVYELLTQQYELAKIQEAREIPSVKVLDEAEVPEKKSFPPRLLISLLGSLMWAVFACTFIIAKDKWSGIDELDPWKTLARDLAGNVRSDARRLWNRPRDLSTNVAVETKESVDWQHSSNGRNGDGD
jgi:hypothetical protein